ncbi:unnamed protein product [Protopolystoma xenopodis]|uniref:Uncharacterized protein n=1 Tax=Protopolystoma xenopodis TaxID=117903 RepID=A0A3S5BQ92_9PLAT|nr:unnamed protein product [Protopolystoma xenopodis]
MTKLHESSGPPRLTCFRPCLYLTLIAGQRALCICLRLLPSSLPVPVSGIQPSESTLNNCHGKAEPQSQRLQGCSTNDHWIVRVDARFNIAADQTALHASINGLVVKPLLTPAWSIIGSKTNASITPLTSTHKGNQENSTPSADLFHLVDTSTLHCDCIMLNSTDSLPLPWWRVTHPDVLDRPTDTSATAFSGSTLSSTCQYRLVWRHVLVLCACVSNPLELGPWSRPFQLPVFDLAFVPVG